MRKVAPILFYLLTMLLGIIYVGDIIILLNKFTGFLGYILWIFVAPILVPAVLFLPWFDAWVTGNGINSRTMWLWGIWMSYGTFVIVYIYIIEDMIKNKISKSKR
jgi:hypothetical protein